VIEAAGFARVKLAKCEWIEDHTSAHLGREVREPSNSGLARNGEQVSCTANEKKNPTAALRLLQLSFEALRHFAARGRQTDCLRTSRLPVVCATKESAKGSFFGGFLAHISVLSRSTAFI
jgi:hypothetical protein